MSRENEINTRNDRLYSGMKLQEYPFAILRNSHGEPQTYYLDVIDAPEKSDSPRPVVIFVHGGGFVNHCDKRQGYIPVFARELTKAGYLVISPDYPVFDDVDQRDACGGFKAGADHAAEAVHETYLYIQQNAEALNADPSRVAIMGGSAGGMTAFSAIAKYNDKYRLFVNCWGSPKDLPDLIDFPPVLSIHGTADQSVDYNLEIPIQDRLEALGIRHQLITLEGSRHTPMDRFREFVPAVLTYLADTMK